jgi:hypothetical protein
MMYSLYTNICKAPQAFTLPLFTFIVFWNPFLRELISQGYGNNLTSLNDGIFTASVFVKERYIEYLWLEAMSAMKFAINPCIRCKTHETEASI